MSEDDEYQIETSNAQTVKEAPPFEKKREEIEKRLVVNLSNATKNSLKAKFGDKEVQLEFIDETQGSVFKVIIDEVVELLWSWTSIEEYKKTVNLILTELSDVVSKLLDSVVGLGNWDSATEFVTVALTSYADWVYTLNSLLANSITLLTAKNPSLSALLPEMIDAISTLSRQAVLDSVRFFSIASALDQEAPLRNLRDSRSSSEELAEKMSHSSRVLRFLDGRIEEKVHSILLSLKPDLEKRSVKPSFHNSVLPITDTDNRPSHRTPVNNTDQTSGSLKIPDDTDMREEVKQPPPQMNRSQSEEKLSKDQFAAIANITTALEIEGSNSELTFSPEQATVIYSKVLASRRIPKDYKEDFIRVYVKLEQYKQQKLDILCLLQDVLSSTDYLRFLPLWLEGINIIPMKNYKDSFMVDLVFIDNAFREQRKPILGHWKKVLWERTAGWFAKAKGFPEVRDSKIVSKAGTKPQDKPRHSRSKSKGKKKQRGRLKKQTSGSQQFNESADYYNDPGNNQAAYGNQPAGWYYYQPDHRDPPVSRGYRSRGVGGTQRMIYRGK